jgi:enoyl-CoA hydratase/carnithine racemase
MAGIETTTDGPIGTLIIDNPSRRNAMTADMYTGVRTATQRLMARDETRVVIVRGAGDVAFGAGSDISEFPTRRMGDQAEAFDVAEHDAWDALAEIPVPVLAAIHGPCMGGGIAMALHCDVRIAADDATFSVPPARLGLAYPQDALRRLVELVGPAQAKLLLYSARVVDAEEALAIGLVQEITPKAELDDHVNALALQMARLAPLTHRSTKLSVDSLTDTTLTADAAASRRDCYASADFREGVQAFLDKRHAAFTGR